VVAVGGFFHETFWEDVTECQATTVLGWKDFCNFLKVDHLKKKPFGIQIYSKPSGKLG